MINNILKRYCLQLNEHFFAGFKIIIVVKIIEKCLVYVLENEPEKCSSIWSLKIKTVDKYIITATHNL